MPKKFTPLLNMERKTRKSYSARFKLEVIEYSKLYGNRRAARHFEIDEKSIREWRKNETILNVMPRENRALRKGSAHWPELEERLKEFILCERGKGFGMSTSRIILQAKSYAQEMQIEDFTGDHSWCFRFMKRHNLVIRSTTSIGQSLPDNWELKVELFRDYLKNNLEGVLPCHFGNMDEVPVSFDMPRTRTVNIKGAKEVRLATTGKEKSNILCVTADGKKLPPMVIFKRKTIPKEKFPSGIYVEANEKGWANEDIIKKWIDRIWKLRPSCFMNPPSMLILDSCRAHLTESVKRVIEKSSRLAVIPGGLTCKLQPLDISVTFKSNLRKRWENWMLEGIHQYTNSGKLQRVSYKEICEWIVRSWEEVNETCVLNGFRKMNNEEVPSETFDPEIISEDNLELLFGNFNVESDNDFDGFD
jgi:DDE superfamily endonuclease/Tc5 transposase DNA-binding domain/Brinker DNA-binding domain